MCTELSLPNEITAGGGVYHILTKELPYENRYSENEDIMTDSGLHIDVTSHFGSEKAFTQDSCQGQSNYDMAEYGNIQGNAITRLQTTTEGQNIQESIDAGLETMIEDVKCFFEVDNSNRVDENIVTEGKTKCENANTLRTYEEQAIKIEKSETQNIPVVVPDKMSFKQEKSVSSATQEIKPRPVNVYQVRGFYSCPQVV